MPVTISRLQPSRIEAIEDWPWLDQELLRTSRSRQICITGHFFRHHPGPNCIPLLSSQRGWAPLPRRQGRECGRTSPGRC